jgi:hypothetical protein
MQEVRRRPKLRLPKAKQLLHPKADKRAVGRQKNARSIRNAKLATDAVNVTSAVVAPLSAFPEDAAAAGQTEKQNAKLATDVVNVTSVEVAPLSAFPEDADADAEQTKKKEPVKNIIHENINNLVN